MDLHCLMGFDEGSILFYWRGSNRFKATSLSIRRPFLVQKVFAPTLESPLRRELQGSKIHKF